jgi:hypothetical protein
MAEKHGFEPAGVVPGSSIPAKISLFTGRGRRVVRTMVLISPTVVVVISEVTLRRAAQVPLLVDVASARAGAHKKLVVLVRGMMVLTRAATMPLRIIILRSVPAFAPIVSEHWAFLDCGPIGRSC